MGSERLPVAVSVIHELVTRRETVATAESLTGGLVGGSLTAVPGSSAAYVGGVVSYATRVKVSVLSVPQSVIDGPGVVSRECVEAMAAGARRVLDADWAVATTGVAGPGPEGGVAAGTVWIGAAGPQGVWAERLTLEGGRDEVRSSTVAAALELLLARLTVDPGV